MGGGICSANNGSEACPTVCAYDYWAVKVNKYGNKGSLLWQNM